ncbi:MAG: DNA polymerase IV [Candidatus Limnocylindria bacterium]
MTRDWILHVDLDEFIAAVEILRRPELRGLPVVVGTSGDPSRLRAVVATASYEARRFGVRSGMPLRTAARRCPKAVFLASDPPAYEAASAKVMSALRTLPVRVEVYGWDEAFLGARTDDPERLAAEVQRAVMAATGLACSVGIGDNKHRAKLATGFAKPAGIYRLTGENWMAVMAERPVDALWGIGRKMSRNLAEAGIVTVAQLAAADENKLADRFGPAMGPWYRQLALGGGGTEIVTVPWEPRSRSRETTFPEDLVERADIAREVAGMARELARETASTGRMVVRVAVKVRFAPFFTHIRSMTLRAPTDDVDEIARAALVVLDRFDDARRPVRLLGVRVEFTR